MSNINENKSIFHHTDSVDKVRKILKGQSFKVQYCTEKIYLSKNSYLHIVVPMVSFADIRLTDYVRTFRKVCSEGEYALGYYGDYAIGLSKEWAIRKNIIPISYVPKPTTILSNNHILKPLESFKKRVLNDDDFGVIINDLPPIASFCKHYEGFLENKGFGKIRYAFHNEQEWRYVPSDMSIKWNFYNNIDEPNYEVQKRKKESLNKRIKRKLEFDLWKDVTFVVVKSDAFVDRIIDIFKKRKDVELRKNPMNQNEIEKRFRYLCSCILTTEQLGSDL